MGAVHEEPGSGPDPDELAAFLATAPAGLQDWANRQLARPAAAAPAAGNHDAGCSTGEAGLAGPAGGSIDTAGSISADNASDTTGDELPAGVTGPPDTTGSPGAGQAAEAETTDAGDEAVGLEAFADDFEELPAARPTRKPGTGRQPGQPTRRNGPGRVNLILVCLLAAAVVIIVQQLGRDAGTSGELPSGHPAISGLPSNHPDIGSMPTPMPSIDQGRVAELAAQIEADPQNTDLRMKLGELYLDALLFQDALDTLKPILDIDPNHLDGLLAIGVAEYNLKMDAEAERHWLHATEIAPTDPTPWFNLGFLYMSADPPDEEHAVQAWHKVIELAPGGDIAERAQRYLDQLERRSPTSTPSR